MEAGGEAGVEVGEVEEEGGAGGGGRNPPPQHSCIHQVLSSDITQHAEDPIIC